MESLKKICVELTQEKFEMLESKYYANGKEKKVGDLVLYVMLIEDDSKEDKHYHLLSINFNDLGSEYKFIGNYFKNEPPTKDIILPIVEGKFVLPKVTDLNESNDCVKHFQPKMINGKNNNMKSLYVYREWCEYHIGFYDDKICIASNIDEACQIFYKNMNVDINYINNHKNEINVFDLEIGFKKFSNNNIK
jgi:hypothetical protein